MEENKDEQEVGKGFNKGLIMAFVGWVLSTVSLPLLATIVFGIIDDTGVNLSDVFFGGGAVLMLFGMLMLIIWIPAAIIAARAYRKKGYQRALIFTVAAYAVSLTVFFGCTGSLRGI